MVGSLFRNRFITFIAACAVASPTPPAMTMVRFPSPLPGWHWRTGKSDHQLRRGSNVDK
jgi:hypothetical protein